MKLFMGGERITLTSFGMESFRKMRFNPMAYMKLYNNLMNSCRIFSMINSVSYFNPPRLFSLIELYLHSHSGAFNNVCWEEEIT